MASLAMPFDASVDMAAQQAYARLVASLGGNENGGVVSFSSNTSGGSLSVAVRLSTCRRCDDTA